jgi:hypothetical protein
MLDLRAPPCVFAEPAADTRAGQNALRRRPAGGLAAGAVADGRYGAGRNAAFT